MSNNLLATDLHLTDNALEEYRWVFMETQLPALCVKHKIDNVYLLGDVWDRKDRHSATLVNRSARALQGVANAIPGDVVIQMGNHDELIVGSSFWEFLNTFNGRVRYITKPTLHNDFLILPFSKDPVNEWASLDFEKPKAVFMHQTAPGANFGDARIVDAAHAHKLPILTGSAITFSGDVHRPQVVNNEYVYIVYVGTPYPVRFNEDWPGRVLIIDSNDPRTIEVVETSTMRRCILDLHPAKINKLVDEFKPGDQVRVRYHTTPDNIKHLTDDEKQVRDLIAQTGATLVSFESVVEEVVTTDDKTVASEDVSTLSDEALLRLFAAEEKIDESILNAGIDIMSRAKT